MKTHKPSRRCQCRNGLVQCQRDRHEDGYHAARYVRDGVQCFDEWGPASARAVEVKRG